MGTSRNPAEMVLKIKSLATTTERRSRLAVEEGALAAKTIMLASAAAKGLNPSSTLAGKKWNVRYDVKGTTNPTALVRYTGPFHLFDNPTKAHEIRPHQFRGTRGKGRRAQKGAALLAAFGLDARDGGALKIGGNFRPAVNHPGTPGARSFPAAKLIAQRRVPRVMAATVSHGWALALR